ncbi:aminopeptidase [Cryobacterium tepidiphilum]|uniref:Aminopeptidase n=1 Tax=Cryobacterium tepidiphilum TaxID=2486026 RepID=A0A3M8LHR3_9MICO|nr:aminopeptidase [Cryobacterium tepidiphilum]RNE64174.1 aminopeptidase [Cryobacterium tepidiphilum]
MPEAAYAPATSQPAGPGTPADDPRWAALATQIADGTRVGNGSKVGIFLTDPEGMPAVEAFVDEVYRRGGIPQVVLSDERFDRSAVAHASTEMLAVPAPLEAWSMEWADVHVSFRAMAVPVAGPVDEERLALQRKGKGVVSTLRWRETRWCLVRVPTRAWADLIGCDYDTLLTQFFDGCLGDWAARRAAWERLAAEFNAADTVRILSPDTDLTLGVAGRTWVAFAGEANLPDGELATAPVDDAVNGHITFPGRFWFAGAPIDDLRLEFLNGLVTGISAATGEGLARKLLTTDAGAGRVGELGIGTNAAFQLYTGDLLLDEKILGTVHIALGRAYPECGGVNQSSLHWDIVKDLRDPGGFLYVGDRAVIDDGVADPALAGGTAPAATGAAS